MTIW
jgi:hypothetical protein